MTFCVRGLYLIVFFVKRKTAYELRISDCSSDVCSSDLNARPIGAFIYAPFRIHDLMTAVLGSQLETIEGLEIYAGEGPAAPLVFSHGTMGWDTHDEKLRIGDRQWTMRVSYGRLLERIGRPLDRKSTRLNSSH